MRLALGTAQFGLAYGLANRSGQLTMEEAAGVLEHASQAGFDTLDTAIAYGDAEARLGQIGVSGWKIVSKLPAMPEATGDKGQWVESMVRGSLARLGVPSIFGLLAHRSADLTGKSGSEVYAALHRLKGEGLIERIGVSIYAPQELEPIMAEHPIDLVQAPYNVVDRRIVSSGWLAKLKGAGAEVHARSAFLQGLLLMDPGQRPARFARWSQLWSQWHAWLEASRLTPLQAAIGFVLSEPSIDRVVVGVDSIAQLKQIIDAARVVPPAAPESLSLEDNDLINPSNWKAA